MELKKETIYYPMLGCDPEFFFKNKSGQIIGAEQVIPKKGLTKDGQKVIIDGVQAELNPRPHTCRDVVASNIRTCFIHLQNNMDKGITCDFSVMSEISKDNLDVLADSSKVFGCAPSRSIYQGLKSRLSLKKVNPEKYRKRAAGGHIHLGFDTNLEMKRALTTDHERTVYMLDILVGNTSVLVDRDAGNKERRKLYGKAGEYRLPKHGLEYRTLSNYWLTSKPMMSFAFGMARMAVDLMSSKECDEYFKAFTSKVDKEKIHKAINNNDFDLAMKNFKAIEPLIVQVAESNYGRTPVNATNINEFKHFIQMVNSKGLHYYFDKDPMKHWVDGAREGNYWMGFNDFLCNVVRKDMKKTPLIKKAA